MNSVGNAHSSLSCSLCLHGPHSLMVAGERVEEPKSSSSSTRLAGEKLFARLPATAATASKNWRCTGHFGQRQYLRGPAAYKHHHPASATSCRCCSKRCSASSRTTADRSSGSDAITFCAGVAYLLSEGLATRAALERESGLATQGRELCHRCRPQ